MILLIDNYDSFTYNLVQRIGEIDPAIDVRVVRNDAITAAEARALNPERVIISPGPCTPNEAGVSRDIIRAFQGQVPLLGVCLGHQCMGDIHGMTVERHAVIMHGKTSPVHHDNLGIFQGLSNPFTATRYHSLIVREPDTLPPGWTVSAWTIEDDGSRIVMGLRYTPPNDEPITEGVQFHPESFMTTEGPHLLANFLNTPWPAGIWTTPPHPATA